jgi:UPF0755 protein
MSDNKDLLNDILNETAENDETDFREAMETADALDEIDEQNFTQVFKEVSSEQNAAEQAYEQPEEYYQQAPYAAPKRGAGYDRQMPPPRKKKKKKKKKKQVNRLPGVLILVTLIFGISTILSVAIISYGKDMLGIGKSDEPHVIVIPENATTLEVSQMLFENDIIKSAKAFELFANLGDEKYFVVGEHFVRPNMPYETLLDELTKVPTEEMGESISITFREGITLIDAANLLEEKHICDAEDFIFYFNSGGFGVDFEQRLPSDSSLKFQKMEGYLFPDTYLFYENSKPEQVCQKIYYNFDTKMKGEFTAEGKTYENRYERMEELGLTLDELITISSIVQMEAANVKDMNDVAAVFRNRIDNKDIFPKLESDPTSNYADQTVRPNIEYYNQTIIDAYDTYKSPGLPPGAISNPGLDAIDAVLTNKKTDYFYFIANIMTNETFFSKTLDEHNAKEAEIKQYYIDNPITEEE